MAYVRKKDNQSSIKPISRLLIANRGEIARRINRTAQCMGISTVAIYADGDVDAPFVHEADFAIALRGETSLDTYLNTEKVLEACKASEADAIHPGYGFLSENSGFAEAVSTAGIVWIGPSPEAIASMGDKLSAKRLMEEAEVPTLPARQILEMETTIALAEEIGYPVLIKASAGGGGRGMRVVEKPEDLGGAIEAARREALSAFGNETLFIEHWLATSRHVEIQILGDQHGNLVHCFERECSIQRRHQKIIEEAPSPAVDEDIRCRMGEAALKAARKIGYSSAGTVEFLLSGSDFYFLEVNTRLQVEHPVTEAITGLDLVREQIRIAEGETLSFKQEDLSIRGHAIEARLYAEDPENNFLPSPGKLLAWQEPTPVTAANSNPNEIGTRIDSGVETGSEVNMNFDPMLAKFIAHAATRREAIIRLSRLLERTRIQGITNNRDFLVATLRTPEFISGATTTDFIEKVNPARKRELSKKECIEAGIAVVMEAQAQQCASARVLKSVPSGWRNTVMPFEKHEFLVSEKPLIVEYRIDRSGKFRVRCEEEELLVTVYQAGRGKVDLEFNNRRSTFFVDRHARRWLVNGPHGDLELFQLPRFADTKQADAERGLIAPMPGVVVSTEVQAGDTVKKGQLLMVLEAMKMEHRITAPRDGIVSEIHVVTGDQVGNGALLVRLAEDSRD